MKKILLVCCLLFFSAKLIAQQFSQYNTGTLYDSFENPSQKAFVPDSSRKFAFNFLPNFNANFFVNSVAQTALKNNIFGYSNNSNTPVGPGRAGIVNADVNVYLIMLKMYAGLKGDQEIGFSAQTKAEGKGLFSNETLALINGTSNFGNNTYTDFNNNFYFQTYHQVSLTYRKNIDNQFAVGFKLSALLGVQYQKLVINSSEADFNTSSNLVNLNLKGTYQTSFIAGTLSPSDYLPSFRNPGAAVSMGASYKTDDGFAIQGNIKDLGFIHWGNLSSTSNFNDGININNPQIAASSVNNIYNQVNNLVHTNQTTGAFTTPIDGRAELSVNKKFWLNYDNTLTYSPTLVASKELFYPGFIGAFVNPVQYLNYVGTVTFTYDDLKTFNVGAQLMFKAANTEFFIGSDKLTQSIHFISQAINPNAPGINQNTAYTGASFFIGFAVKFGPVIEHHPNASVASFK